MSDRFKPSANGIGWEVQRLAPEGWRACTDPYPTREEAQAALDDLYRRDTEFRVYEALQR